VNTPPKVLISSHQKRNVQGELPLRASSPWLGPSDEIPDVGFGAFLQLMHEHFPQLVYSRESHYYARFKTRNQSPADPSPQIYPVIAREQGTIVGHEDIEGLLEEFGIKQQDFREPSMYFTSLPRQNRNNDSSNSSATSCGESISNCTTTEAA
jgi:hypothetical protein